MTPPVVRLTNCLTIAADVHGHSQTGADTLAWPDQAFQQVNGLPLAFGTKKSQVQILSPRRTTGRRVLTESV